MSDNKEPRIIYHEDIKWIPFKEYAKLQEGIEYINRQLADERSGDCDKDKTIRRLESNLKSAIDHMKELEAKLELAKEALKFECGDRCNSEYNPCNAREVLEKLK